MIYRVITQRQRLKHTRKSSLEDEPTVLANHELPLAILYWQFVFAIQVSFSATVS